MRLDLGPSLGDAKAAALVEIDRQAEAARLRYITAGAGQALEYSATEAEARAYVAAGSGDPGDYPWLDAERLAQGGTVTLGDVAAEVIAQADAWHAAGAEIKRVRRAAKLRVEAATTPPEVRAVVEGLAWPAPEPAVEPAPPVEG